MLQQFGSLYWIYPQTFQGTYKCLYENSKETFKSSEVNLTTQGKTFVGVVIGSASYKKSSRKF